MPKKTFQNHFIKTLKRLGGFLIAGLFVLAVIFAFSRPSLSPGTETKDLKADNEVLGSNSGDTFPADNDGNVNVSVGEGVKADSYLVYDETSGKVLSSRNPNTAVAIASITKLMTAYITQKYGNLEDTWAINSASTSSIHPVLGLVPGDKVIIKDLVDAMLIGSANDSAAALGAYVSSIKKQPVIDVMNNEAKALGMNSTHYENPIGFDSEQNYSTASDLKLLLNAVRPLSLFSEIDRKQSYSFVSQTGKTYSVKATNTLLASDPDIHAIKTGFTDEAKGAMITAIHHDDKKFIIIVLGSTDREDDTKLLKKHILEEILQ
ncbi:MAG TPA: serine hydrolase [Patescibacteria group bacterium]|jgi:D-alanyl-D-alanine carboxypeptidase|nr:serine hydrolase [Patescibacteria group bacterium]